MHMRTETGHTVWLLRDCLRTVKFWEKFYLNFSPKPRLQSIWRGRYTAMESLDHGFKDSEHKHSNDRRLCDAQNAPEVTLRSVCSAQKQVGARKNVRETRALKKSLCGDDRCEELKCEPGRLGARDLKRGSVVPSGQTAGSLMWRWTGGYQ